MLLFSKKGDVLFNPEEIVEALLAESSLDFKDKGEYLREGICPSCGKKELFVRKSNPWKIACSRLNNCGCMYSFKELLPDFSTNFFKKFPPSNKNPSATADAYLSRARGFNIEKIKGWYDQEIYRMESGEYVPTIRFYLDKERTRYWERLISREIKDGQKANIGGKRKIDGSLFKGDAWEPPNQSLKKEDTCVVTEGIFNAIPFLASGFKAVSSISCSNFISGFIEKHKGKKIKWLLAYDGDDAGKKNMLKHYIKVRAMDERAAVLLLKDEKQDWNDYYKKGFFKKNNFLKECEYEGQLFVAGSVVEKAWIIFKKFPYRHKILVDFASSIYRVEIDKKNLEANALSLAKDIEDFRVYCSVEKICTVFPQFLYIDKDEVLGEQKYVFKVGYQSRMPDTMMNLDGSCIANEKTFHSALLNNTSGGQFLGTKNDFKQISQKWFSKDILIIRSVPFVGYDTQTDSWVFQNHSFHDGMEISKNEYGYFETSSGGIKSSLNTLPMKTGGGFDPSWFNNFLKAFHWQGVTVLAFWLGSLFVQQIRDSQKSFPFLEFTGEPGSGKSTVLEFCWKLVGRNHEGVDLLKTSEAGRRRIFSQVSNLPVVLIESDRDRGDKTSKVRQFNFDEFKDFFNGRATGTLGVARRNNDVEEHLFKASLIISQNAEVDGSPATLERIVHCHADKKHHNLGGEKTREIAKWFERQTTESVSGFLAKALKNEKKILKKYFKSFKENEIYFDQPEINNDRIIKNHAQIASCGEALSIIFPQMTQEIYDGFKRYLLGRAVSRKSRLAQDHPLVDKFWDIYEYIEHDSNDETSINHSKQPNQIAINFNQFRDKAYSYGQEPIDLTMLKKHLNIGCKRHKLVEKNKAMWVARSQKTIKCWVFEK